MAQLRFVIAVIAHAVVTITVQIGQDAVEGFAGHLLDSYFDR